MTLPHSFSYGASDPSQIVQYGTYYCLTPIGTQQGHIFPVNRKIFLPVEDTVNWVFSHEWNEADNYAKGVINSLSQTSSLADATSRVALRKIGGSVHVSACAVYMDSAPPTINVKTKLFSSNGSGELLSLIEKFRMDTHAGLIPPGSARASAMAANVKSLAIDLQKKIGGSAVGANSRVSDTALDLGNNMLNIAQNAVNGLGNGSKAVQAGLVDHPEWWKVQVVTFYKEGYTVLATMEDMVCTGLNVTFFAPFYNGEPSLIELDLSFKHGFRGLRSSMQFGGSL